MKEEEKAALMNAVKYKTFHHVQWYLNPPDKLKHDDESFFDYELLKAALDRRHQTIANFLLKLGCRVRNPQKTSSEETPLHLAMLLGNMAIVRKLINSGASLYDKNPMGETPLYAAYKEKRFNVIDAFLSFFGCASVKQLIKWKPLNPEDKDDMIHFHIACVRNNLEAVERYLSAGFNVNIPFSLDNPELSGLNPFQYSIMNEFKDKDMIINFLKHNADLSIKNSNGHTPLQMIYYADCFLITKEMILSQMFLYGNDTKFCNYEDNNNVSHFHLCCITEHLEIVKVFINKGIDINGAIPSNSPMHPGFTPLHLAVMNGTYEMVILLLEYGADCNIADKNYTTPLHTACEQGRYKGRIIEKLLDYDACPFAIDKNKQTPLLKAFIQNDITNLRPHIFDMLISKIPRNINYSDDQKLSHWHVVCSRNDISRVIDFLESGLPVDSCVVSGVYSGYTALHFAVLYNQRDVVEVLLKWNAQVNVATSKFKFTPLHMACDYKHMKYLSYTDDSINFDWTSDRNNQLDIIKLLVQYKANIDTQDTLGMTPLLQTCAYNGWLTRINEEINIRIPEIIRILLGEKASLNTFTNNTKSILHIITESDFLKNSDVLADFLISKGANVHAMDKAGFTPLHFATKYRKYKLVNVFLKHKANVNAKSDNGMIPLSLVLKNAEFSSKDKDVIELLLENGSDVNLRYANDKIVWLDALIRLRIYILKMLLKYGADVNVKNMSGQPSIIHIFSNWILETRDSINASHAKTFHVIHHHLIKLKRINRYVNEEVQKFYEKLLKHYLETCENYSRTLYEQDNFVKHSEEELNRMKSIKIDNYTSLYDILLKDVHELSKHVKNSTLVKILEDQNTYVTFPLYSYLLKVQFKKALIRISFLEYANESLSFIIGLSLPGLCYDSVFHYLTNNEISNLKNAVPLSEKIKMRKRIADNDCSNIQPLAKKQKI